jgi:predicted metalloprotease with PDZ domain
MSLRCAVLALCLTLVSSASALAQAVIEYVVSVPAPEQRWLQVEATFPTKAGAPIEVRMARSSPGRYATHEFGKNVYLFEARGAGDSTLPVEQVAPAHWRIRATGPTVRVRYRLFADRVDGTYAAVDGTHAHLNIPAAFAFAPALSDTPVRVRFNQPAGKAWKVATQLFPTDDPLTFTAPNLQYFMDSPVEFSAHAVREFTVAQPGRDAARIRLAVHHLGTDAELDAFAGSVEKIVREQAAIFGELPAFDGGTYTFLMDYLPWASGDGMEHRNSTICSAPAGLSAGARLAGTASHEFFHAWNVERIRPASLEPFDFTQANMSGELWLAEGVTTYYGTLTMIRAGLVAPDAGVAQMSGFVNSVLLSPGTQFRSAVDMSRLAPYVDAASSIDPTNWDNTYVSYYTYGAALGLGLDLTLRERSGGKVTLDDFMRTLWTTHGTPAGKAAGYVARPYTLKDVEAALAKTSGDVAFARDFFAQHVTGTEPLPYRRLFAAVGYELRERADAPFLGPLDLRVQQGTLRVASNTIAGSPVHDAGVGRGDVIVSLNGKPLTQSGEWEAAVAALTVGSTVDLVFESRGETKTATLTVQKDPRLTITPMPQRTPEQEKLRDGWLGSKAK